MPSLLLATVTLAQASGPMGLSKRHHIQTLLADPVIQADWQEKPGRPERG